MALTSGSGRTDQATGTGQGNEESHTSRENVALAWTEENLCETAPMSSASASVFVSVVSA
ncbi:MAG: hypothetical protein JWP30_1640 [Homoserinimonas sp.]|nr:hypothetical protein [Homoserinimonas sp.]